MRAMLSYFTFFKYYANACVTEPLNMMTDEQLKLITFVIINQNKEREKQKHQKIPSFNAAKWYHRIVVEFTVDKVV